MFRFRVQNAYLSDRLFNVLERESFHIYIACLCLPVYLTEALFMLIGSSALLMTIFKLLLSLGALSTEVGEEI